VTVNGKPYNKLWIEYATLAKGAKIVFTMSDQPNMELGTAEDVAPPSLVV
jgi:putative alpha-1,2-mannosidase